MKKTAAYGPSGHTGRPVVPEEFPGPDSDDELGSDGRLDSDGRGELELATVAESGALLVVVVGANGGVVEDEDNVGRKVE